MGQDLPAQIARLKTLSRRQLLELWEKEYRRAAPSGIRRELLIPFLAYRIQESTYGGLKPKRRAELRRIVLDSAKPGASRNLKLQARMKPGTRLLREWRGKTHEVMVTESSFAYHGSVYRSLSEIARKITGTQWSGPAFFGLKNGTSTERQSL